MAVLDEAQQQFLLAARRAVLGTIAPDGRPRLMPVCFVVESANPPIVLVPLDEKPKSVADLRQLARVRDIRRDPRVSLLVDRWDEDWSRLAWLRCDGSAELIEGAAASGAVAALRVKYAQYAAQALELRPLIRITIEQSRSWGALSTAADAPAHQP